MRSPNTISALSDSQLKRVMQTVTEQHINSARLRDELIDHLACEIEQRLASQVSFEVALKQAMAAFGSGGLVEVERNVSFHVNPLFFMNRLQNALLACLGLALLGVVGKMLSLPASNELTLLGMVGFSILLILLGFRRAADVPRSTSRFLLHSSLAALAVAGALYALLAPMRTEMLSVGLGLLAAALLWLAVRPSEWRTLSQANPRYIQRAVLLPSALLIVYFVGVGAYHQFVRPFKTTISAAPTQLR